MRTLLDNLSFIQYNDLIRVPNRFQSMGNHNDRFIFGKSFNRRLQTVFVFRVNIRRCLIKERFLPYIDNWATCDMLAVKVMKNHLDTFIEEVCRWMKSDRTYTIRFGIGMLMRYYLGDEFRIEYPRKVALVQSDEYYVNMMRAWYFATALAKQYDQILPFIEERKLDVWTHNKSIQKAIESYRITPEQKVYLKTLKI